MVGKTFSGKSLTLRLLSKYLEDCEKSTMSLKEKLPEIIKIFPKSISLNNLFGYYDE